MTVFSSQVKELCLIYKREKRERERIYLSCTRLLRRQLAPVCSPSGEANIKGSKSVCGSFERQQDMFDISKFKL